MYQACTKKRGGGKVTTKEGTTYVNIAAHGTQPWRKNQAHRADKTAHTDQVSQSEGLIVEAGEQDHTDSRHAVEDAKDRKLLYASQNLIDRKLSIEMVAAAFRTNKPWCCA
jgi:hypothetical protein